MATSKCMYCNSEAVGYGCPYGPKGVHVHPYNSGKCIYCGSQAVGIGCSYNPNGDIHVHGVDFNNMIKESMNNGITVGILMKRLSLPFKDWPAFKLGIINENGVIIKKPNSLIEKNAFTNVDAYITKIKRMLSEHQIDLINNSLYLSNKKEEIKDLDLYTEMYSKQYDVKEKINNIFEQLHDIVSKALVSGISSNEIEKMIIESINH